MRAVAASLALIAGVGIAAAPAADPVRGAQIFERVCAPCHGQGPGDDGPKLLPGSAALAAKYKDGELSPFLEKRTDLGPDQLRYFVRHGSGAMPMFRKTEVSDADIAAIAAYLAKDD